MKQDKKNEFNRIISSIKDQVELVFANQNREAERKNEEQRAGNKRKDQNTEKIYLQLQDVARELKKIEKGVRQCEKLRKERRDLFAQKTKKFMDCLAHLTKDKNIRIKINKHMEHLADRSRECVDETATALLKYQTESMAFCGKSYEYFQSYFSYKPAVEKAFMELSELAFLWENIENLQSVTDPSAKEIYLPLQFRNTDMKALEEEIAIIMAEFYSKYDKPEKLSSPVAPPPPIVQKITEKSDLQMAHECLFGFTRPQEIAKAIDIYQKEASKSNPDPTVFNVLGVLHENGKGFAKDLSKAFKYFMRSAQQGNPQGLYKVGQYLEKGLLNFKHFFDGLYANRDAEVRGGIEYYEKAASKGHLDALTDLGFIYERGVKHEDGLQFFIEPHPDHAKKYYEKAKESNFPRAYNNLGNLLICQNSVSQNLNQNAGLQKGIKYLRKARELGCPKASLNLGKCYLTGTGVPLNLEQARVLFKEATELGEMQGRLEYLRSYIGTNLEEEGTMNELAETGRMLLVENRNNPEALFMMGLLEEKGIGMAPNKQSSFHYVAASAKLEFPPALTRLGDYYYSGYYVDKNYDSAKILYEKAAERGDSQAFLNLALMQEKGLLSMGTTIGSTEELYRKAEELGNTNAMLMTGLKREGSLMRNDKVLLAAERGNYQALKLLTLNNLNFTPHQAANSQIKKMSTFYMKETLPSKHKFGSFI